MDRSTANNVLCELLRSTADLPPIADWKEVIEQCDRERITPFLYNRLRRQPAWQSVPDPAQKALQKINTSAAAKELLRHKEASRHLAVIEAAGLKPITFKGAALAYEFYEEPHCRPRMDTDLLFANQAQAEKAALLLEADNYTLSPLHEGDLMSKAFTLSKLDPTGILEHQFDLHWRIAYEHRYQEIFEYQKLLPQCRLNAFGYRVPPPLVSLLISCIHNESERPNNFHNRLVWYVDLKLLTEKFHKQDWEILLQQAAELQVGDAVLNMLHPASTCLAFNLPTGLTQQLKQSGRLGTVENFHSTRQVIRNLGYLSPRQKTRYLWQLLFPPPRSMKAEYAVTNKAELLAAYFRRIGNRLKLYLLKK